MKIIILETAIAPSNLFKQDRSASYLSSKFIQNRDTINFILNTAGRPGEYWALGIHKNPVELGEHPSLLKIYRIDYSSTSNIKGADTYFHYKFIRNITNYSNSKLLNSLPINNYGELVYILDSNELPNDINQLINGLIPEETRASRQNSILNTNLFNLTDWKSFENKTSILFNLLGFQIDFLGHKNQMKRVPDMYLYAPKSFKNNMFWLTIDCKFIDDYYPTADDIRAVNEYLMKKIETIDYEYGIPPEKGFFLFVGKSISKNIDKGINEIFDFTNLKGGAISYSNLLYLVERKLKMGYKFYLPRIMKLLNNKIVTVKEIDRVFQSKDEYM